MSDRYSLPRRDVLRTGVALGAFGAGLPAGIGSVEARSGTREYSFYDDFEDGSIGNDPGWTVYEPGG